MAGRADTFDPVKRPSAVISVALACMAIGCGGADSSDHKSDRGTAATNVVSAFIDALVDRDGAKACSYLSAPGKAHVAVIVTNDESQTVSFDCTRRFDEYTSALGEENLARLQSMDFRQITDKSWYPPPEAAPEAKRVARTHLPFSPNGDGLKDPVLTVDLTKDGWRLENVPDPDEDFPPRDR
jgi:hypothetical protein